MYAYKILHNGSDFNLCLQPLWSLEHLSFRMLKVALSQEVEKKSDEICSALGCIRLCFVSLLARLVRLFCKERQAIRLSLGTGEFRGWSILYTRYDWWERILCLLRRKWGNWEGQGLFETKRLQAWASQAVIIIHEVVNKNPGFGRIYEESAHETSIHIEHSISSRNCATSAHQWTTKSRAKTFLVIEDQYTRAFRSFLGLHQILLFVF